MALCGEVEQTEQLNFHIHDNLDRDNATVTALVHFGQETRTLEITETPDEEYAYDFVLSQNQRGVAILEIAVDGVQVPDCVMKLASISPSFSPTPNKSNLKKGVVRRKEEQK